MRDVIRGQWSICRGLAVLGTVGAFLFTIALSDAPRLHARIHKVLGPAHECAVTLVASGNYHHATPTALVDVHIAVFQFSKIPALTPQWVESPFLGACIFEHAPPAHF